MTVQEVKKLFSMASEVIIGKEEELCRIDAETGDGDHGVAIARVAKAVIGVSKTDHRTLEEYFSAVSEAIAAINGGSCIPLCATIFAGMADAAEGVTEYGTDMAKKIFVGALEGIRLISDAKPGDKTMVDALVPAVEAARTCVGNEIDVLRSAAQAAREGAEATRNMVAKYGRAKNLKEDSLGHLDAGAVSIATFIGSLYENACFEKEARG